MLKSLFGFNWQKSDAHLLLLSKFLTPKTISNFSESEVWRSALNESPSKAIERFLSEGVIGEAGLAAKLDYKHKLPELKSMASSRGISTAGRKAELIERLIQASSKDMQSAVNDLRVLLCTERGKTIAERYIADEKAKRDEVEKEVYRLLNLKKFKDASMVIASLEAKQVFPAGIGIDWKNYDPRRDAEILTVIFHEKPKVLSAVDDHTLEQIRVDTGMQYLGCTTKKQYQSTKGSSGIDSDWAIRMLSSYAHFRVNIATFRQGGVIKKVAIRTANDSQVCEACKELSEKTYTLDRVPELPYQKCTCKFGCRCFITPRAE